MSRRSTPPPEQNHNLEDDDDGADDGDKRVSNASVNFRVPAEIKHVLQTIFQNAGSTETSVLDMLDLSKLDWKSSAGAIIGSLLGFADLQWSADGKRVWRRGNEDDVIEWATGDRRASLRPASRTASAREEAQAASSAHDAAQVKIKGSAAQRRGAEAAKVAPMRTLPTATPTADAVAPVPAAEACVARRAAADIVVVVVVGRVVRVRGHGRVHGKLNSHLVRQRPTRPQLPIVKEAAVRLPTALVLVLVVDGRVTRWQRARRARVAAPVDGRLVLTALAALAALVHRRREG